MKILQVIPVFNPPELYGGSQQVVYQISKELVKRGHEVTIYTSDVKRSNLKERISTKVEKVDKVKVIHFRTISPCLSKNFGIMITPEMKNMLEHEKIFDIVHVHEVRGYQHIIVWKYAKNGVPYVIQAHGNLDQRKGLFRKLYDYFYLHRILANARICIALNEYEVEQYSRMGVDLNKIIVLPNGIDLTEYSNLPAKGSFKRKFGIPDSEKILLYLGRIHKVKGLDLLVRAFSNVLAEFDGVKLIIAGVDDGYLSELKALIKALKIEDTILFTGPLYGRDKLEAYVDADVYVLPSRYETFPMGLLEAYACGKPVIASKVGGLKDLVIDGETGLLFNVGDFRQLAEKILFLLNDEDTTNEMGKKARRFVEESYPIEKTVDILERIYRVQIKSCQSAVL